MATAYDHLLTVFRELSHVNDVFHATRRKFSTSPGTEAAKTSSDFSDYSILGSSGRVTSWSIELDASREGTEARWHLVVELDHSSASCEITAAAGFQGKYGPMDLREIGPFAVTSLDELGLKLGQAIEELFGDLEGDFLAAISEDRAEMRRLGLGAVDDSGQGIQPQG